MQVQSIRASTAESHTISLHRLAIVVINGLIWTDSTASISHFSTSLNLPFLVHLLYKICSGIGYIDAMRITSFFIPIIFFTSTCSAQLKPCYDVHGKPASQIPCDPSANVSACCFLGGVCVTNLHCHGDAVGDTFERVGGCTDKLGNDPACPLPFLRGITSSYSLLVIVGESDLLMIWQHRLKCAELVWLYAKHYRLRRWNILYVPGQRNLLFRPPRTQRDQVP